MHSRFRKCLAVGTLVATTAACTTPQHTNALIFGTNTGFGIDIGQTPTGVPSLLVGYRRQEAVFMPLVANVRYNANGTAVACDVGPGVVGRRSPAASSAGVPPCFLVGQHEGAIDSYSVLASFGARFSARATDPSASGGLAQFFATGIAAQLLAIRGGPALVAISEAAERQDPAAVAPALSALLNNPTVVTRAGVIRTETIEARTAAMNYLNSLTLEDEFARRFRRFAARLGEPEFCTNLMRAACLKKVEDDSLIAAQAPDDLDAAVAAAKEEQ